MSTMTVAVDLAKSIFEVAVAEQSNRISERKRLTRKQFERFIARQPAAQFVLEACGTAHFWGRHLQERGHSVALLPTQHVKPYRRGNKTDRLARRAYALCRDNADYDSQYTLGGVAGQTIPVSPSARGNPPTSRLRATMSDDNGETGRTGAGASRQIAGLP